MTTIDKRYRQAKKLAADLSIHIEPNKYDFTSLFELLDVGSSWIIQDLISLKAWRTKVKRHIQELSSFIDSEYFIPGLIEFMSRYYMERKPHESVIPGTSAKILIGFLWSNNYSNKLGISRAFPDIVSVHNCCQLFIILEQLILAWEFEDLGQVILTPDGMIQNDKYPYYAQSFSKQGLHEYKTLNDAVAQIWSNRHIILQLHTILAGAAPKDGKLFEGSFLSEIPASQIKFWSRFWALMQIYAAVNNRNVLSDREFMGVRLFYQWDLTPRTGQNSTLQNVIYNNFWQPEWHIEELKKDYPFLQNMIVQRPLIRIIKSENLFGTSNVLLHDAVNNLVEDYLHSNAGSNLYEKYFSGPFEARTIGLLRKHGYICGEVTIQGTWRCGEHPLYLRTKKTMPGQIDILAVIHSQKIAILADCKMLHFPHNSKAQRNLRSKFSDDDEGGFFKKLRKKNQWLTECSDNPTKDYKMIQLLITHRHIPIPKGSKGLVLSFEELETYLERKTAPVEWINT